MYTQYFGLSEPLFGNTENPEKLFLTAANKAAYEQLVADLTAAKKVVVLNGPAGCGKTTIVRKAVRDLAFSTELIEVQSNEFKLNELIGYIEGKLAIGVDSMASLTQRVANLKDALQKKHIEHAVILIEQAHRIESDLINGVQLLTQSNVNRPANIQFVFVGLSESANRLKQIALRNFEPDDLGLCDIKPLEGEEISCYIQHYVEQAGCNNKSLFDAAAIERVKKFSGGIPRLINLLCNGGLLASYLEEKDHVDAAAIDEASTHCLYPGFEKMESLPGHKRIEIRSNGGLAVEKVSIVQGWPFDDMADDSDATEVLVEATRGSYTVNDVDDLSNVQASGQKSERSSEIPDHVDDPSSSAPLPHSIKVSPGAWDRLSSHNSEPTAESSFASSESVDVETATAAPSLEQSITDDVGVGKKTKKGWSLLPEVINKATQHRRASNPAERLDSRDLDSPVEPSTDRDNVVAEKHVAVNQTGNVAGLDHSTRLPNSDIDNGIAEISERNESVSDNPVLEELSSSSVTVNEKSESETTGSVTDMTKKMGLGSGGSRESKSMSLSEMIGKASEQIDKTVHDSIQRVISNGDFAVSESDSGPGQRKQNGSVRESTEKLQDLMQTHAEINQNPITPAKTNGKLMGAKLDESGTGVDSSRSTGLEPAIESVLAPHGSAGLDSDNPPANSYASTAVALIVLAIGLFLTFTSFKLPFGVADDASEDFAKITTEKFQLKAFSGDLSNGHESFGPSSTPREDKLNDDVTENVADTSPLVNNDNQSQHQPNIDLSDEFADIAPSSDEQNSKQASIQARIESLLTLADQQIAKKQLMTPEHDNALATFNTILEISPGHSDALSGITRIKELYMAWARNEVRHDNIQQAKLLYAKALKVSPDDLAILTALSKLKSKKYSQYHSITANTVPQYSGFISHNQRIEELLDEANRQIYLRQLVNPAGANAFDTYNKVLWLDPGNREALEGLQWIKMTFVNWAQSAAANRDWGRAEVFFLRALKVAPNDPQLISEFDEFRRQAKN